MRRTPRVRDCWRATRRRPARAANRRYQTPSPICEPARIFIPDSIRCQPTSFGASCPALAIRHSSSPAVHDLPFAPDSNLVRLHSVATLGSERPLTGIETLAAPVRNTPKSSGLGIWALAQRIDFDQDPRTDHMHMVTSRRYPPASASREASPHRSVRSGVLDQERRAPPQAYPCVRRQEPARRTHRGSWDQPVAGPQSWR